MEPNNNFQMCCLPTHFGFRTNKAAEIRGRISEGTRGVAPSNANWLKLHKAIAGVVPLCCAVCLGVHSVGHKSRK